MTDLARTSAPRLKKAEPTGVVAVDDPLVRTHLATEPIKRGAQEGDIPHQESSCPRLPPSWRPARRDRRRPAGPFADQRHVRRRYGRKTARAPAARLTY